jgi:anti-sigma factor RsiW
VGCDDLDPLIEGFADGSIEVSAEHRAHLAACPRCAAALERAQSVERWLASRETPQPPAGFTTAVMTRIVEDAWRAERAIDLGFNLAIAAGIAVILSAGAGLAWSLGLLQINVDLGMVFAAATSRMEGPVISELQTTLIAAALLTTALVLWWWAEGATD